ncbi:MAG: MFS transporter, partial [Acidobacteria bacterium]|nr:MFS transporter [Acidobacteriota bacterium]
FQLGVISLAQFLGMTLWFSATAVTPTLVREFGLSTSEAAWLTMAVQAGFVVGTLVLAVVNVADLVAGPRLICAGALIGAAANAAMLLEPGAWSAIGLRFATGLGLAAVYPPAMKMAASWFRARRGLALGLLIGALTLGKAVPYLITTIFGDAWRQPMLTASILATAGGLLVLAVARDGPYLAPTVRFDPHAIRRLLSIRGVRLALIGYLGHMWELYAMWTWIGVFATASFVAAGLGPSASAAGSLAAFLAIGAGAIGCAVAGLLADSWGKAHVARLALVGSGICAALTPLVFGRAPIWTFALAVAWGITVVADSAQFSALVSEYAPPHQVGTALTFQTSIGFLLTMITIDLLPRLATATSWQYAAWLLVPGPVIGALAMRALSARA